MTAALEDAFLSRRDPPLNVSKIGRTDLRARLTELRGIDARAEDPLS